MLDLTKKTPGAAEKALHAFLQKKAKELGQQPDEVILQTPIQSDACGTGKNWRVIWEAGPFEWAINATMGESIYAGEVMCYGAPPQVLLMGAVKYCAEPYYSFDVCFGSV